MSFANQSCDFSHARNKEAETDFYSLVNGVNSFTDHQFPKDEAIYWTNGGLEDTNSQPAKDLRSGKIEWSRASDLGESHTLFGDQGVMPEDIEQG